jgi:hypothetical protein
VWNVEANDGSSGSRNNWELDLEVGRRGKKRTDIYNIINGVSLLFKDSQCQMKGIADQIGADNADHLKC